MSLAESIGDEASDRRSRGADAILHQEAAEVVAHPHLAARQAFPLVDHPGPGAVRITAVPFHVDNRPVAPRGPAPYRVGEHTRAVLGDVLGYSKERIEELRRLRVIETV